MKRNSHSENAAKILVNRQPPAIRGRLEESEFLQVCGLKTYLYVEIAGTEVLLRDLLAGVRKIGSKNPEVRVRAVSGGGASLRRSKEGFILSLEKGHIACSHLGFLSLVSRNRSRRISAFGKIVTEIGPTADFSALQSIAEKRPLRDNEVENVADELSNGVRGTQARLRDKIRNGRAMLADLVPDNIGYFEKFCGPDPGDMRPEEYIGSVLPGYRRELLRRNLRKGLEICLLGSLRDDLYPGPWLEGLGNGPLWTALTACQPDLDPVSLLAALDLAFYRLADKRFQKLAEDAVRTLVQDRFSRSESVDLYELTPLLARFALNRINLLDGGALRPPYWKRMCAWMQAAFIARLSVELRLDVDSLSVAINESLDLGGEHANAVDLRREPMIEAGSMATLSLRRQIVGRLLSLAGRYPSVAAVEFNAAEIKQACDRLIEGGAPLCWRLPGPLDGHRRPEEMETALAEELAGKINEVADERLISGLANSAQHLRLGVSLKESLRAAIMRESKREDLEKRLTSLCLLGTVAAVERDTSLAELAAERLSRCSGELAEWRAIWMAIETLLRAAAAIEDEVSSAAWLENRLFELASQIQAGKPATILLDHIRALKRVTKLELGILRRAEAAAVAAIY